MTGKTKEIKWVVIRIKADGWIPVDDELAELKAKIEKTAKRAIKAEIQVETDITYRTK